MLPYRISKIAAGLLILILMFVTANFVAGPARSPAATLHAEPLYVVLEKQDIREYELGERYGQLPQNSVHLSVEQIEREYILGERYGVTPQGYAEQQALREYWLGEKYGQTP